MSDQSRVVERVKGELTAEEGGDGEGGTARGEVFDEDGVA